MTRLNLIAALSLFIATTVLLSSLHASQVLGATATAQMDDAKKAGHDEANTKIVHDLHHHSDKTGSQLIKDASDNSHYVDSRSLRLARHKKETIRDRLHRFQRIFEDIALTHHLFI